MVEGLKGVKFDREMRMKRLIDLRRKIKNMWIEGTMSSEQYVMLLMNCFTHLAPNSDTIEIFKYTLEQLRRKALRQRSKRISPEKFLL